jgi:hypothetical protein
VIVVGHRPGLAAAVDRTIALTDDGRLATAPPVLPGGAR